MSTTSTQSPAPVKRSFTAAASEYVNDRTGIAVAIKGLGRKAFPDHWSFLLGEVALYSFVVILISGTFLTFFFQASMVEVEYDGSFVPLKGVEMSVAMASTLDISFDIRGGLFVRQMHHWAALLFIAAIGLHMLRIFFMTDIARYEGISLDGVLVCQMVERGVEMVVGVTHDELFGPTVTVGLGGVLVEVLRDAAVRVPPFGDDQARAMLAELRGRALLDGVRGAPPVDIDALVEVVIRVQRMALELGDDIAELDINPLMVLPRGQGAVALDALVMCR